MTRYTVTPAPLFRWQVKRGDFVMAVFVTRDEAEAYAEAKEASHG
ncbi:hypothetical protein ABIA16_003844 [Sinorhizobium fredii]